jgi:chromosomal replication initiator protein
VTLAERIISSDSKSSVVLLARVCEHFEITMTELLSKDRHAHIADARHVAAWLLRETGLSYPSIGKVLERDHTTIMHSVRKVEREIASEPRAAETLRRLHSAPEGRMRVA